MKSLFPLEDFGTSRRKEPPAPSAPIGPSATEIEIMKAQSYETGYKAGYDDAVNATNDDQDRIGAEFARNLQDLGFTFHEARAHVMRAMEPLLAEIVSKVLPHLISETIGQTIVEQLMPMAEMASDSPIEVRVCPRNRAILEELSREISTVPLTIIEEETLADGQVYLRMGKIEKHIDMTTAIERIGDAIKAIYVLNETQEKSKEHG